MCRDVMVSTFDSRWSVSGSSLDRAHFSVLGQDTFIALVVPPFSQILVNSEFMLRVTLRWTGWGGGG